MEKIIYICGTGDPGKTIIDELKKGNMPYSPGKIFPDYRCPLLRSNSMATRLAMMEMCQKVIVVDGEDSVTKEELKHAHKLGIPVRRVGLDYDRLYKAIFEGGK